MAASTPPPTSFAGQICMLISAVEESDRQKAILAEHYKNSYADRKENLQNWRNEQELKHKDEIIDYLRIHPKAKSTEISRSIERDRSIVLRRLRKLEADGIVACVSNGDILRWELLI